MSEQTREAIAAREAAKRPKPVVAPAKKSRKTAVPWDVMADVPAYTPPEPL